LAKLVRGKLKALLGRRRPDLVLPASVWRKPWIVHITAWRAGQQAVLDYLARYVFRLAITNTRLVGLNDHAVTVRYTHCKSGPLANLPDRRRGIQAPLPPTPVAQGLPSQGLPSQGLS
jgi:hypothetical protein